MRSRARVNIYARLGQRGVGKGGRYTCYTRTKGGHLQHWYSWTGQGIGLIYVCEN